MSDRRTDYAEYLTLVSYYHSFGSIRSTIGKYATELLDDERSYIIYQHMQLASISSSLAHYYVQTQSGLLFLPYLIVERIKAKKLSDDIEQSYHEKALRLPK